MTVGSFDLALALSVENNEVGQLARDYLAQRVRIRELARKNLSLACRFEALREGPEGPFLQMVVDRLSMIRTAHHPPGS